MIFFKVGKLRRQAAYWRVLCQVAALLLITSACQYRPGYQTTSGARSCHQYLSTLNQEIKQAGLEDAQHTKLPDFPHLRTDRFLASLLPDIKNPAQYYLWLDQAAELALDGFQVELKNLAPANSRSSLKVEKCIHTLLASEKESQTPGAYLKDQAIVEDDYKSWQRILGVYPLVLLPVAWGINNHLDDMREAYKHEKKSRDENVNSAPALAPPTKKIIYKPQPGSQLTKNDLAGLLQNAGNNPLSIPVLTHQEQQILFKNFAPVWVVSSKGPADQIGTMAWSTDGSTPVAKTDKATVYTKISYTRYKKKVLLQLNYIFWFPERPLSSVFDLLGGHLDGITWRITLDSDGQVLMQDTIHNCGCYHMFYPGSQLQARTPSDSLAEIAFAPQASPTLKKDEHYNIHIDHSTHYITRLTSKKIILQGAQSPAATRNYEMVPYRILRNLPHPKHGLRSVFNDQGLIPDSSRRERYLFWPLGIASAGAMRQWGRHATAFIGRRHFDDPDLIEKNFIPSNHR